MKNQQLHSAQNKIGKDIVRKVEKFQPARGDFNYADRERAVTDAYNLYKETRRLAKNYRNDPFLAEANMNAGRLWNAALNRAFKPGFWGNFDRLSHGDTAGLETAIEFLEADPWLFRTGYIKTKLIRFIKPHMLTTTDKERLARVVLTVVDKRDHRDFRAFCRLARKVDSPELREGLTYRLKSTDPNVCRRARWVLEALAQKDQQDTKV